MEKVKLNNQIVSMRKYAKQAKVHVINKLVKQIKLLQNRKGSEIQIQKAKRKAVRFLEAVALVKKIKPDDVSKLALLKAKDWKNVLLNKNSSVHDRCIAMLANYGAVQKEVEAFYCANKELVLKISDYITQWEEKNKFPKDSPKTNKMSFTNKSSKNILRNDLKDESLAVSEKSKFKTDLKIKSGANENDTAFEVTKSDEKGILKAENSDSNVEEMDIVAAVEKSTNSRKLVRVNKENESNENNTISDEVANSEEENESNENDGKETIASNYLNNDNEAEDSSDEKSHMDKTCISLSKSDSLFKIDSNIKNKSKAITLFNLNELEGLDEIPVDSSFNDDEKESSEDEANETLQNKNTDPFFLGHTKEDFNSKRLDDSSEDNEVDLSSKDSLNPFKHRTQTRSFYHQKDDQFSQRKHIQKSSYNPYHASKRFKRDNENSIHRDKFSSWDCYNKFQEKNINKKRNDFKLQKKPFPPQDTHNKKQFKNISKGYGNKDNSLKHNLPHKKGNASETLHPSWEAKRKQKKLLSTSFQGKRIIFDD